MIHDNLANMLSAIKNAEVKGKAAIAIKPATKLATIVLGTLKREGYIAEYTVNRDARGGSISIALCGAINNIGAIKPRFSAKTNEFTKYEQRYLPAKDFGRLLISTPKGLMTHIEAKAKNTGGTLIAYVY